MFPSRVSTVRRSVSSYNYSPDGSVFKLDCNYPYDENIGGSWNFYNPPCPQQELGTAEYEILLSSPYNGYDNPHSYLR